MPRMPAKVKECWERRLPAQAGLRVRPEMPQPAKMLLRVRRIPGYLRTKLRFDFVSLVQQVYRTTSVPAKMAWPLRFCATSYSPQ